jgi:zinc and cadmium transporter
MWLYSLGSILLVSLLSLAGMVALALSGEALRKALPYLVALAAGGLLGGASFHLLPESFRGVGAGRAPFLLLVGIVGFFVLEKFFRWTHCHHVKCDARHTRPLAAMNIAGDALHNFADGMAIAASYLISVPLGVSTTAAVLMHEIPQEIGDFGVLLHGGMSTQRALAFNFLSALSAMLGGLLTLLMGARVEGLSGALLPVAAGGFLYIAGSDLIPELHYETRPPASAAQLGSLLLGIGFMALLE